MLRGVAHLRSDLGAGSSGDAEWHALRHALEVARGAGESDLVVLGDSASVIDQAAGIAHPRVEASLRRDVSALVASFRRVRFRRIKRSQNLAGIVLEQVRQGRRKP